MRFPDKLERHLGRFALANATLYLIIGQVFFYLVALLGVFDLERIALLPDKALHGEWWRVATFVLMPPATGPLFAAFGWYMFYLMGSALESNWGIFRYNLFLLLGCALTAGAAFLHPYAYATNLFIGGAVFLAFAFLNPDFQLLILFILPVRIKWVALLTWLSYGYQFYTGTWATRSMVLAATGTFLVFFAGDLVRSVRAGRRRRAHQAEDAARDREPRHRCVVCGKTDLSHPQEDFRYCSKCAGARAYCREHILNHEHILTEETEA